MLSSVFAFPRKAMGCMDSSSCCSSWDFYQNLLFLLIEDFLDNFVLALWNRKSEKNQILKKFKNSRNSKHSNFRFLVWYWFSETFLYFLSTFWKLDLGLHRVRKAFVLLVFVLLNMIRCFLSQIDQLKSRNASVLTIPVRETKYAVLNLFVQQHPNVNSYFSFPKVRRSVSLAGKVCWYPNPEATSYLSQMIVLCY